MESEYSGSNSYIKELLPAKVINISKGVGSFITIDIEKESKANMHLWIYLCDWAFFHKGAQILTNEEISE